ncbi:hypothetical protein [Actinoplanes sp. NPDC023714]|uniref:hypothetical protein n=1 Tax=Actinoplanes sp. NPDC023714 TaxID=3154322 RepID=UPI0033EE2624
MMVLFVAVVGLILAAVLALWPLSKGPAPEKPRWDGADKPRWDGSDEPRWNGSEKPRWTGPETPRWSPQEPDGERPRRFRGSARVNPGSQGHAEPGAAPTTLEGILTGQLLSGEISQRQYLRALESLAARDEERHPLTLRWDDRPGAWS